MKAVAIFPRRSRTRVSIENIGQAGASSRLAVRVAFMAVPVALCLGGCAAPRNAFPAHTVNVARPDSLAEFVASAPVGVSATYPQGGTLRVTADYYSAAGQECRSFVMESASVPRLVCNGGYGWAEVRPLLGARAP